MTAAVIWWVGDVWGKTAHRMAEGAAEGETSRALCGRRMVDPFPLPPSKKQVSVRLCRKCHDIDFLPFPDTDRDATRGGRSRIDMSRAIRGNDMGYDEG